MRVADRVSYRPGRILRWIWCGPGCSILEQTHVSSQCRPPMRNGLDVCGEVARCRSNALETSPPAGLSTKCTRSGLHNDVSFVRTPGASGTRVAVCRGSEEMHSAIRTVREDIEVFDIFAHAGGMGLDMRLRSKCFPEPDRVSQQAAKPAKVFESLLNGGWGRAPDVWMSLNSSRCI